MGEHPSLFGRADELQSIDAFLDRADRHGEALLLAGQPGVGKTSLLQAAIATASANGSLVLRANGVEFEADLRFAALNQVLLPLHPQLDQLGAVHREVLSVALGFREGTTQNYSVVFDAAAALLRQASTSGPVLLAVDDLQWLDHASAAVLEMLARNLVQTRIGFLAAFRTEAETFFDPSGLPRLEVRPLDSDVAAGLVSTRFPLLAARVLQRVLDEAQGNPLALLELPSVLSDPEQTARRPLPEVLPLSQRLQSLFASRVQRLPATTRRLLLLAALDTGELRFARSRLSGESARADLAPAQQSRLVTVDDATLRVTFRHPLVRSTVVAVSTSSERRDAHRELATWAAEPDRRAWHLAEATVQPDELVAGLLERAASGMLRRGDGVGAVTALLRSADLSPRSSDRARRLTGAAYVGATVTGDLHNVAGLVAEARRIAPELAGSLRLVLASSALRLHADGDIDTAHRLLVAAIADRTQLDNTVDDELVESMHNLFEVCRYGARPEPWPLLNAVRARCAQQPLRQQQLLPLDSSLAGSAPTGERNLDGLDGAIDGLPDETDPRWIVRVAGAAVVLDRTGDCREALCRVVDDGRQGGAVASAITAMTLLCADGFLAGRWDEAEQLASEGLALCDALGYRLSAALFRLSAAQIAGARGDVDAVRTVTDEINGWAAPRGVVALQLNCRQVLVLAALGRCDFEAAYQQATAISPAGVIPPHLPPALWVAMDLVEAAIRTGRREEALVHVRAMQGADVAARSPRVEMLFAAAAGITASDRLCGAHFERALATPGADRWPFDLARVQLAFGERQRRMRAPAESRRYLTAALQIFQRMEAVPWVDRATKELQATGVSKSRSTGFGPAALTPQEREVALLAASGLTNRLIAERLFLSHRTVGAHLRQIFPKLAISSRASLRDALDPVG